MAKVSVIVPVYKVEKYLKECVDSIINQTFKDIEVILVDDGSPDSCPQIIDEYAKNDKRVVAIHKTNGGYASAINKGLDVANGEYISIVESDDYCDIYMIEKLYDAITKTNADMATGDFYFLDNSEEKVYHLVKYDNGITKDENGCFNLETNPVIISKQAYPWKNMYRKSFLEKFNIKMLEDGKGAYEDLPWNATVLSKAKKIVHVPHPIYYYRRDAENSSSNTDNPSLINYLGRREQIRNILIENNKFSKEVKEFYWQITHKGSLLFHKQISPKYKKQYFYKMQNLFKLSIVDNLEFKYFYPRMQDLFNVVMNKPFYNLFFYFKKRQIENTLICLKTYFI